MNWRVLQSKIGFARSVKLMNTFAPFVGAGIAVHSVDPDERALEVTLTMRWFNRNFAGIHFGGSLYAMCDPFFAMLLMNKLGSEYVALDKSSRIDFRRPGRGVVRARFAITDADVETARSEVASRGKCDLSFETIVIGPDDEVVARVYKVVNVRRVAVGHP